MTASAFIRQRHRRSTATGLALVAPVIALMVVFIYWPFAHSVGLSFTEGDFQTQTFVGVDNYIALMRDSDFWQSLITTAKYIAVLVPLVVAVPFVLALMVLPLRKRHTKAAYRTILFLPTILPFAVMAIAWLWIFNPLGGPLNSLLEVVGLEPRRWLDSPTTAFWCIIAVSAWKLIGFNTILYAAALESVPAEYIEAARLDGAGRWHLARHLYVQLISPTILFVVVTATIFVTEDVFDAINVLTAGGPYGTTENILYYMYEKAMVFFEIGPASAVATIATVVIVAITWLQLHMARRHVHYD